MKHKKCNKMFNFQDLPDELVLKILGYSETKDTTYYIWSIIQEN
jgi:hypothetical protein